MEDNGLDSTSFPQGNHRFLKIVAHETSHSITNRVAEVISSDPTFAELFSHWVGLDKGLRCKLLEIVRNMTVPSIEG